MFIQSDNYGALRSLIVRILNAEGDYPVRNPLVVEAVCEAQRRGIKAGFRIDPNEPEWPVAYIELPTGQVSWHLPQHENAWDGHDTAAKYLRCAQFATQLATPRTVDFMQQDLQNRRNPVEMGELHTIHIE